MPKSIFGFFQGLPLVFALAVSTAFAQGGPPQFLSRVDGGGAGPAERGVVRAQRVAPDIAALQQLGAQLRARPSERRALAIQFFDDAAFVVLIDRIEAVGFRDWISYQGHLANGEGNVVIVDAEGVIAANVDSMGRRFQLRNFGERGYFARQVDLNSIPDHPADEPQPPEANVIPISTANKVEAVPDDGSTIDVMVVYTPAARAAQGGTAAMNSLVALAISEGNSIYANSGVVQRYRLVYAGEVAWTETTMSPDLTAITDTADGNMDDIHILRDAYGADFVSLWGIYPEACGLGWLMSNESSGFATNAFNVVYYICATGNYSFEHELGHNMGLRHDNYMDSATTTVTPAAGGASTTVAYAHGYVDLANRFRTVMAYDNQCNASGFSCTRIANFSNPSVFITAPYNGVNAPTGDNTGAILVPNTWRAFETQALNDTRETTANFRTAVDTSGGGKVVFMPKTYSVSESGGTVQLTVVRLAGSAGAATVNYATANGTATAGSDYLSTTGSLNWADGDASSRTINVPILPDATLEGNEAFTVALSGATGASVGSNGGTATVTIVDDDSDNFPTGCAMPAGWSTNADSNIGWSVSNDVFFGTPCAIRSAKILSPATDFATYGYSDVSYTATFLAGNVTFNYKVSSYPAYGVFEFLVDGVVVKTDTGEVGWTGYTYAISAGSHTLTWRYKNRLYFACSGAIPAPPGGSNCADRVWIDTVVLPTGAPVTLQSVVSRKSHTNAGVFDVTVDSGQAIGGSVTSEPRPKSSNTHSVVFNFNGGVATPGTATCIDAASASISCSASVSGSSVIVTMTGLADAKRATVSLTNVNASGTNVSASIGFLVGDLNGDRAVTASDILRAKGKTGQSVGASTYKYDDDLSGALDAADISAVKANAGVSI